MKIRRAAALTVLLAAGALAQVGYSGAADAADATTSEVTLKASLQKEDSYTSQFFAPLSAVPQSIASPKKANGVKKAFNSATSLANFVFDLRGFDWSKEGANAILEEKLKPKSEQAREFLQHKEEDDRELAVVTDTLQLASVIGIDEAKTEKARAALEANVGTEEANRVLEKLKAADSMPATSQDDKASVDVEQKCNRLKNILEAASETDPVVEAMTHRLHKYNHRSKFLQITAKVAYATLGVAAFTPTLAAPIAETTLLTFMMVTGGPEQDKLLKEVYLSKCLQSRASLINEKAHLAVDCYDMAMHTKNPRLLACSRDLIRQMTSEKAMAAFINPDLEPVADAETETASAEATTTTNSL